MSNIYSPEYKALKYKDEHLKNYKEERAMYILLRGFSAPLSVMEATNKMKISHQGEVITSTIMWHGLW